MLIHYDADEYKPFVDYQPCSFHRDNPGKLYAGCTCSTVFGSQRRSDAEIRAIRAERRHKEEEEILRRAAEITARRNLADETNQ